MRRMKQTTKTAVSHSEGLQRGEAYILLRECDDFQKHIVLQSEVQITLTDLHNVRRSETDFI